MKRSGNETITLTHAQFLISAGAFEGMLLAVAFLLGWGLSCHPTAHLHWDKTDLMMGLLATIPMLLLLAVCFVSTSKGIVAIRVFLRETLGPLLNRCNLLDLFLLALLAGLCEEVLFRGLLYFLIHPWNPTLAVIVSNLLFGFAHAVTPFYAMLAAFMGLYLTALLAVDPTPNLLIPITAHTAYDFVAFLVVIWDWRRWKRLNPQYSPSADASAEDEETDANKP
ncbi:MAG: CPBP family intramembrane metalloprotease [Planctomycetaceae bacterium]|nr:CPBP family intramembrane metalloprotease [Planctomycetaceae bacterium]